MKHRRKDKKGLIFWVGFALVLILVFGAGAAQADTGGAEEPFAPPAPERGTGLVPDAQAKAEMDARTAYYADNKTIKQYIYDKQFLPGGIQPPKKDWDASPTISIVPPNDDMASATVIGSLPYTDTVADTILATVEPGEPAYDCGYNVGKTVWYRYTPSSNGYFVVDTFGSDYDTVLHVFTEPGAVPLDCNDDAQFYQSRVIIDGASGTTYLIGVGGFDEDYGSMTINLHSVGAFTSCAAVDVSEAECDALTALYTDTGGASWYDNSGWLALDEVCTWYGVSCYGSSVNELTLGYNNLTGSFITDLTALSNLFYIWLAGNTLSGDLGTVIGLLPNSLADISLYNNQFTGTIPASLLSFSTLWWLDLGQNQLSGDIGPAIGNIPSSVDFLGLYENGFTGEVPASISSFTGLWLFDISMNGVSGDLATLIGNLPVNLQYLFLNYNGFSGLIPSSISSLTNLYAIDLSYNMKIGGPIPLDITSLSLNHFNFEFTFLCEPTDPAYTTWASTIPAYYPGLCVGTLPDLTIVDVYFDPVSPIPAAGFDAHVVVHNGGGELVTNFYIDLYQDNAPTGCYDVGDYWVMETGIGAGATMDILFAIPGQAAGQYIFNAYVEVDCAIPELSETNNDFGPLQINVAALSPLFWDGFETADFSQWSGVNYGGGWLYICGPGAMNGLWGACFERGTNDRRKQLIDETPVYQQSFNVRFNFDPNSLSMGEAERFRFMQSKMLTARPYYIVMRNIGGVYGIQLKARLDNGDYLRTGWYDLTDAPHTIEVDWMAATGVGKDDGWAHLFVDGVLAGQIIGLDNDTIYVDIFKIGFTSRLEDKIISGIFYLDDVATSTSGYIGIP